MPPSSPQIVVLTPVRNEAWILDRFLAVTSRFADLILVADQGSDDGSTAIYPRYPKVVVIENPLGKYDEASRQQLLINEARARVSGPRVLLALDADEVVAANAVNTRGWQTAIAAPPGTVLYFEKPDLLAGLERCVRYSTPWPLGYVDDGTAHQARSIHSLRIPIPASAPRLQINDVKVLHYAFTRPAAQRAKSRMYSLIEATLGTSRLPHRRQAYAANRDWTLGGKVETVRAEWLAGWQEAGIDMTTVRTERYYWQDFETLRMLGSHPAWRFWLDDVWDQDWEECYRLGREMERVGLLNRAVRPPPPGTALAGRILDLAYSVAQSVRRRFVSRRRWQWE